MRKRRKGRKKKNMGQNKEDEEEEGEEEEGGEGEEEEEAGEKRTKKKERTRGGHIYYVKAKQIKKAQAKSQVKQKKAQATQAQVEVWHLQRLAPLFFERGPQIYYQEKFQNQKQEQTKQDR